MKKHLTNNWINFLIIIAFALFVAVSFRTGFAPGQAIFKDQFYRFFKEMILFLPVMFILIGLGDEWINREKVERHIGKGSGLKGIVIAVFLSMAQAGPLYGAFPVTYLLWRKGASIRNIFIYIGAFCTIKIPMIAFEIGFLGWKFSVLRTLFTLPVIILIGIVMEKLLKNKSFEIKNP